MLDDGNMRKNRESCKQSVTILIIQDAARFVNGIFIKNSHLSRKCLQYFFCRITKSLQMSLCGVGAGNGSKGAAATVRERAKRKKLTFSAL